MVFQRMFTFGVCKYCHLEYSRFRYRHIYALLLKNVYWSSLVTLAVADPGFSRGASLLHVIFCQILAGNYMKMKEFGPRGGVPGTPLYSPLLSGCFWLFVSEFWEAHWCADHMTQWRHWRAPASARATFVKLSQHLIQQFGWNYHLLSLFVFAIPKQWRIQDFPRGGGTNSPGWAPTYDFAKFSQKLHEIERIWDPGGVPRTPLDPPLLRLIFLNG